MWLDQQTREILEREAADPAIALETARFSVVLLSRVDGNGHFQAALSKLMIVEEAMRALRLQLPATIQRGLSRSEALMWQFEIACADEMSMFVRDDLLERSNSQYIKELVAKVSASAELSRVTAIIQDIPSNQEGKRFREQFYLGQAVVPITRDFYYKKARIMAHWARKVGGQVTVVAASTGA